MPEISALKIISFIFITLVQHESAVVLWYTTLREYTEHWSQAALASFVIISIIDLGWLYFLFVITDKSLHKLAAVGWVHRLIVRILPTPWFAKLRSFFVKNEPADGAAKLDGLKSSRSRFKRFVAGSGYIGIATCASLPGPGLKEIGIIMALTPKYKAHGFKIMYVGGMIKTIMTLLVYGGLYRAVETLLHQMIS